MDSSAHVSQHTSEGSVSPRSHALHALQGSTSRGGQGSHRQRAQGHRGRTRGIRGRDGATTRHPAALADAHLQRRRRLLRRRRVGQPLALALAPARRSTPFRRCAHEKRRRWQQQQQQRRQKAGHGAGRPGRCHGRSQRRSWRRRRRRRRRHPRHARARRAPEQRREMRARRCRRLLRHSPEPKKAAATTTAGLL